MNKRFLSLINVRIMGFEDTWHHQTDSIVCLKGKPVAQEQDVRIFPTNQGKAAVYSPNSCMAHEGLRRGPFCRFAGTDFLTFAPPIFSFFHVSRSWLSPASMIRWYPRCTKYSGLNSAKNKMLCFESGVLAERVVCRPNVGSVFLSLSPF